MHTELITFVVSLFAILNPIGNTAIFVGMTEGKTRAYQRNAAWVCGVSMAIILLIVTWLGSDVLKFFGISVGAMQGAGGLIILLIGLTMLRGERHGAHHEEPHNSIAVVPMAIPIFVGPGAMSVVIAQANHFSSMSDRLLLSAVCPILSVICFGFLWFAPSIAKILGPAGMKVVTRVMGLILSSIAFGMIASGLLKLFPGLA